MAGDPAVASNSTNPQKFANSPQNGDFSPKRDFRLDVSIEKEPLLHSGRHEFAGADGSGRSVDGLSSPSSPNRPRYVVADNFERLTQPVATPNGPFTWATDGHQPHRIQAGSMISVNSQSHDILQELLMSNARWLWFWFLFSFARTEAEVTPNDLLPTPPDGGVGWLMVFAVFMSNVLLDCVGYAFGILLPAIQQEFGCGKGAAALAGAVCMGICSIEGPFIGGLVNKYGVRPVSMAGALFVVFGLALSSVAPSLIVLYIGFSIIAGMGFGMVYLPQLVHIGYYFESKRAVATGIASAGGGVGTIASAPVTVTLLRHLGLRNTLRSLSLLTVPVLLLSALLWPLKPKGGAEARKLLSIELDDKNHKLKALLSRISVDDDQNISLHAESPVGTDSRNGPAVGDNTSPRFPLPSQQPAPEVRFGAVPALSVSRQVSQLTEGDSDRQIPSRTRAGSRLSGADVEKFARLRHALGALDDGSQIGDGAEHSADASAAASRRLRDCPQEAATSIVSMASVKPEDFSRPLYRKDVLYAGSVVGLDECKRVGNDLQAYRQSQVAVPVVQDPWAAPPEVKIVKRHRFDLSAFLSVLNEMADFSMVKKPTVLCLCIANVFGMLAYYVPFVFLPARAEALGITPEDAGLLLSLIGVSNTIGRVAFGWLADRRCCTALGLSNGAMGLAGVMSCALMLVTQYWGMAVYAVGFGLAAAAFIALTSIVLVELVGLEALTSSYGIICLFRGVACLVGLPLAGVIYDAMGSYDMCFVYAGVLFTVSALLGLLTWLIQFRAARLPASEPLHGADENGAAAESGNLLGAAATAAQKFDILPPVQEEETVEQQTGVNNSQATSRQASGLPGNQTSA